MKKTLLGTTALVSASLVAGAALASDPLTLTVSGQLITGFYIVDSDSDASGTAADDTKIPLLMRNLDIGGEGTLDNGLVVGANLKLQMGDDEGDAARDDEATFSEAYAYLEGGFGRAEIGATDGAAFKMHYSSPWFVPGNGVDSPNIYNGVLGAATPARTSTYSLLAEDENKVSYFTPRFGGFQLGVSYTPDTGPNDPTGKTFGNPGKNDGVKDVVEVAMNYAGSLDAVEVGIDGYYVTADSSAKDKEDPQEWGVGVNLGFEGFTLGGAYAETEGLALSTQNTPSETANDDAQTVWTIGLAYGTGPWTVGVAYLDSRGERKGETVDAESRFIQIGGGYSLGAGVDLGLDIQLIEENEIGKPGTYESNSAGLVLAVSF